MKKILLITHHEFGDPGIISKILHKNYLLTTINFKNLKRLNLDDIQKYSAFILFGGKMSANSLSKETKVEYSQVKYNLPKVLFIKFLKIKFLIL